MESDVYGQHAHTECGHLLPCGCTVGTASGPLDIGARFPEIGIRTNGVRLRLIRQFQGPTMQNGSVLFLCRPEQVSGSGMDRPGVSGSFFWNGVSMHSGSELLWSSMKGNRARYGGAILAVGLATAFGYAGPLVLRSTIDSVIGSRPLNLPGPLVNLFTALGGREAFVHALWASGLVIVGITLLNGLFSLIQGRFAAVAAESTAQNMRNRLYDHLQHLPYDYHGKAETGDLIQRCTSDVETVRRFIAVQLVEVGRTFFLVGLAVPLLFSLAARLALIALAVVPLIFGFSFFFFSWVRSAFARSDAAEGRMSTTLQENLTGVRVVRAFGRQSFELERFDRRNAEYRNLTYRLVRLLATYWSISDLLCMFQIGVLLIVGILWARAGQLSIGTLVVFLTVEGMLLWPVRQMGRILADMGKAAVSLGRISQILGEVVEPMDAGGKRSPIRGGVEFRNVSFAYPNGQPVLRNISFVAAPGSTVAILGPTGSGKSSLVQLLPRLYDYTSGAVFIDGVELKSIDRVWVRRHVGFVLQEPFLYARTIRQNIRMARSQATNAEIEDAARAAAVHDVIVGFDRGYETPIGERGVNLSGGQKQRLAIARALIAECPILVFDDSLSAVDTETDMAIRQALDDRRKSGAGDRQAAPTTFIISHRITTLARADLILVLEHGRIVESGSHEQLLSAGGLYRRVWEIQSSVAVAEG